MEELTITWDTILAFFGAVAIIGGNSYYGPMYPMYDMGGSYMDGNSYNMNYGQGYGMPMYGRGYARTSSKEEMAMELKELLNEAKDEATRKAISEAIAKLEK